MVKSEIWYEEEEERKEYISEWFEDATGLRRTDDFEEYKEKILKIVARAKEGDILTTKEKDLLNYIAGEKDIESLLLDTYGLIKKGQIDEQEEFKKQILEDRIFTKVKGKNYSIGDKKAEGFSKGIKYKVVVEKYLVAGKIKIRGRNKKGQFVSFINPD